jgi:hypothetical protein
VAAQLLAVGGECPDGVVLPQRWVGAERIVRWHLQEHDVPAVAEIVGLAVAEQKPVAEADRAAIDHDTA